MLIYILVILGVSLIVRIYQLSHADAKITYPSTPSYLSLIKDVALLSTTPFAKKQLQSRFMTFITELGSRSLDEQGSGIAYFRLPNLTPVFVLSNKSVIQQFYAKENEKKFGQRTIFSKTGNDTWP